MKLLILGRHGQIATHLRELAPSAVCWGRSDLDLLGTDAATIEAQILAAAPEAIINAAAYTAVDRAESERAQAWALNAAAPAAMASAAQRLGVPLVHFSTEYVFDGTQQAPYESDSPVAPLGVYGKSKLAGELAVATLCNTGWILRCSWVFSEHGNNFVKTMLRLGAERDELAIVADQYGRPSYAGDLARIALRLATVAARREVSLPAGVYHLGSGPDTTWHAFAKLIFEQARAHRFLDRAPHVRAISTAEYPTPAMRPLRAVLAPSKNLLDALGGLPDWRTGLVHAISKLSKQL